MIAERGRVDSRGRHHEAVAVAQPGECGGGDRAVVLELRGAGDDDQRAIARGQLDRLRAGRVPEPRADHAHALWQAGPLVVERGAGEVEGQRRPMARLGDVGERRQANRGPSGVHRGHPRAAVEPPHHDLEAAVAHRAQRPAHRPQSEPERRHPAAAFFEQEGAALGPGEAPLLGHRLGAEGGAVDQGEVGLDRLQRRFEVGDLVGGAGGEGGEGGGARGDRVAGEVIAMGEVLDRGRKRLGLEPRRAHRLDRRRQRSHVDLGAAPAQLQ